MNKEDAIYSPAGTTCAPTMRFVGGGETLARRDWIVKRWNYSVTKQNISSSGFFQTELILINNHENTDFEINI